jgi:hypothetical protein
VDKAGELKPIFGGIHTFSSGTVLEYQEGKLSVEVHNEKVNFGNRVYFSWNGNL